MEYIKYGIFDLFVFLIPGCFFLFSGCYIENFDLAHPALMISRSFFTASISFFQGTVLIAVSYVTGFLLSTIGNLTLKLYELVTRQNIPKAESKSKKYVLVRHFSQPNQHYIEMWNMLKNFSSAISASTLILSIYYRIKFDSFTWLHFSFSLILFLFLLNRAATYHRWAINDLSAGDENLDELRKSSPTK